MTVVAEKLREAKALIERGWCQGYYKCRDRHCSLGAIEDAADEHWTLIPEVTMPLVRAASVGEPYHLIAWNDAPERTQAEVLAAFDRAIELAEAGQ